MYNEQLEIQGFDSEPCAGSRERERRMRGVLTQLTLRDENRLYAESGGVSQHNRGLGFRPGFLNRATGEIAPSCYVDGCPAPIHLLDGLPESWVERRDPSGHVLAIHAEVVAGFIRNDQFYTRDQAARAAAH